MGTNTGIGIGIGIPFKNNVLGEGKPYLPPEIKDSLKAVVIAYGKTNNDSDRAIVKNLVDASNPFVISNAAFKLNSGFGGFVEDFTSWDRIDSSTAEISNDGSKIKCINTILNVQYLFNSINKDIPSFKVKISNFTKGNIAYYYRKEDGTEAFLRIEPSPLDKVLELPKSYNTVEGGTGSRGGFYSSNINIGVTIEQIPSFEGAFVTDGINDLITSTKTVQEMGITDEVTVVSMIHQIDLNSTYTIATTNYIENSNSREHVRSDVYNYGKTGIYGYSASLINNTKSDIKNILGDEADYYVKSTNSLQTIFDAKFSVVGRISELTEASQVAWYWTIIANKVLTTDQINQVIAYFNLDRTLKPDILCNITKQGITNDNHADFNDKLIDYSGNGRDIQMNNLAWKGGSGIAAKPFETIKDYTIVSDEARQKLTIYNEFSYKVKSNTPNHYWTVQSIIKDNTSYQVTIITDKDCYWINSTSFTNNEGNKESIRKEYPVKANTPTQVIICGLDQFEYPEGIEPTTAVSYVNLEYAGEVTVTFIPSCKGGLLLDGVNDFGKVTGMPIYKDYTIVVDYERISGREEALISKAYIVNQGAFVLMETSGTAKHSYSFGAYTAFNRDDFTRTLLYQSKYKCGDVNLTIGKGIDGDTLWLGTLRNNDYRFFNGAIYSLMSFPYSMSEFLIERQLKKHKLGTLYPDMVEFRPVIKSNASYDNIVFYYKNEKVENGTYLTVGSSIGMHIRLSSSPVNEIKSITVNGIPATFKYHDANNNIYQYDFNLTSKSPQNINITIDEYIRYEDIVQPYPVIFQITDRNTNQRYSWGDKIKVGSSIRLSQGEKPNLLSGLYSIQSYEYEGETYSYNQLTNLNIILTKQSISLSCNKIWLLDDNEPKCILSPRLLRIPNSSYKILGYIPDISGHGNHGVIHNSAYAEGSGVNEDGSYQFDDVDDFVTIPTLSSGGKQVLMKVNWNTINSIIYDQRGSGGFAIYCSDYNNPSDSITVPAYKGRNAAGTTYIDGIRNEYIIASQLRNVTHNIVEILDTSYAAGNINPIIGKSNINANYGSLALYDFMLFDNISTDDKIKQLNEYVGIEAKVELPPYYWDAYGKTNLDADKATIQQRGVAVGDYDLTNTNFAYDKMSGFGGYTLGKFTNSWSLSNNNSISIVARNPYDITLKKLGENSDWEFNNTELKIISNPVSVKFKSDKNIRFTCDYHYYTVGGNSEGAPLEITSKDLIANEDTIITISPISQENIDKYNIDINRGYYLIYFRLSLTLAVNEEVTIEMLPLYPNGLAYDGVSDFTDNKNIPILTDFSFIIKREILGLETNWSMLVIKGDKVYNNGIGNAFILEHNSNGVNYVYSYGKLNQIKRDDSKIIYLTPESYNGNPIIKGENGDNLGLVLSRHWRGIIYKTILYSKTISLLQINFLKNLMEKDEIIDLNNPIFIQE